MATAPFAVNEHRLIHTMFSAAVSSCSTFSSEIDTSPFAWRSDEMFRGLLKPRSNFVTEIVLYIAPTQSYMYPEERLGVAALNRTSTSSIGSATEVV